MIGREARRIALAAGVLGLATAAPASAQLLDAIVSSYQSSSGLWLQRMLPIAQGTFALLAAIELAISGLLWGLRRDSIDQILGEALKKFLLLSFLFALISAFPLFVPMITHGFEAAGQVASGQTVVNPSGVLAIGIELATQILLSVGSLSSFYPVGSTVASFTALIVVLAFASIAAQLVLVLVETTIVLSGGILFLGFAGFRGTASFADNYLTWSFHVGIKIFLLYLLVGVGSSVAATWAELLPATLLVNGWQPLFEVLGGALIFALLVWRIPTTVAAHLTQGASFRLHDALRGGGA
ncbi:MAG TPA: P-type conjugative transfer protein TrbL [Thermoanaerobaculia bacterium]|nr:P-type conjugative transfer protein TrbL [Thermoanaerobaculia bacterium]